MNFMVQVWSSARSGPSSVYWYCVRLTRSSTVRSWIGCMYSVMPSTFASSGSQAVHHVRGADLALVERLEIDQDAPAVQRGVDAVHADERGKALHRRVFEDDIGKRLLPAGHGRERNRLGRLGDGLNDARVLHREEPLRHDNVQHDGEEQRRRGHDQDGRLVLQDHLKRPAVKPDDGLEKALRFPVEPSLGRLVPRPQQQGAHHRRERQRDHGGNQDGHAEGDREFAEQPPDDVAHEQHRDQHRDERHGQRHDGEPDLLGAFQAACSG